MEKKAEYVFSSFLQRNRETDASEENLRDTPDRR